MSKDSERKVSTASSIIGKKTSMGTVWPKLPPDHPLFKNGFVFGVKNSKNLLEAV